MLNLSKIHKFPSVWAYRTMDFAALAHSCAPNVHVDTISRIASVESSFNPYAIGVVGGRLERQPQNLAEAVATAQMLEANGYNYSLGIVQVNRKNLPTYGLSLESAFDPCANLRAGGAILEDCYRRAAPSTTALTDAFSCYYTGNFSAGYKLGYVAKVQQAQGVPFAPDGLAIPVVPMMTGKVVTGKHRKVATPATPAPAPVDPSPLFVSATPQKEVAANDDKTSASTPKGPASALLF